MLIIIGTIVILLIFNFGYTGSENFHKDHRFGFFPAVSGAWNIAEETFMKGLTWLNMFKVRYSWGKQVMIS